MKINNLQDIDISKYKIAYYPNSSMNSYKHTQDEVMALAEAGLPCDVDDLIVALIPNVTRLTECGGDDWNDHNAQDNASGFYRYPKGTVFLKGKLGGELLLVDGEKMYEN